MTAHYGKAGLRQEESPVSLRESVVSEWSISIYKRIFDVTCSLIALIVLSPAMLVISLLISITSDGPIIFRQSRIGAKGRIFTILKFRTMGPSAQDQLISHVCVRGDPRVTRIGALLRLSKLDELPQLFNILRGEMSLVGPRPKLPHHEGLLLSVRPGLTGPATLLFRFEDRLLDSVLAKDLDDFYETQIKPLKARIDATYLEEASLLSDLGLLFATILSCVGLQTKPSLSALSFSIRSTTSSRRALEGIDNN
jgi:lipopolysaccharide/colanic/teichoic acid biosynthesis glycosyltransferase